jgi:hypothetical protein
MLNRLNSIQLFYFLFWEQAMADEKRTPNPERVAFLRTLPVEVKQSITGEEAEIFMFEKDIPESLYEKIKDFITEE